MVKGAFACLVAVASRGASAWSNIPLSASQHVLAADEDAALAGQEISATKMASAAKLTTTNHLTFEAVTKRTLDVLGYTTILLT